MTGYFKRMGQLGRAGGARYVRAGPRVPKEPSLEAISLEVPAAGSPPVMGAAAAPSSAPDGSFARRETAGAPPKPSTPVERSDQATQPKPTVSKPSLQGDPASDVVSVSGPQIQVRPSFSSSSLPNPAPQPVSRSSHEARAVSQRLSEPLHTLPDPSSGPTLKSTDPARLPAGRDPVLPTASSLPETLQDVRVTERTRIAREISSAPEPIGKAIPREILTAPMREPAGSVGEQELILSPEPKGEPERSERTQHSFTDEKSSAPLSTAPQAKPDIEVNIGAITLSLDPEPHVPVSPPAAMPAPKPRAGGIWSDGRSLSRSYLRRV